MLERRPEDALVKLVLTVVTVLTVLTGINLSTNRDVVWKNQAKNQFFFQTTSRLVDRFNILYDFSGHKPDRF